MTRALLDEARRHDEAMTEGPWKVGRDFDYVSVGPFQFKDNNEGPEKDYNGIAWLRTNLRALLDAHEQALGEVEHWREARRHALEGGDILRSQLTALRSAITALHTDAERWLTESDDRSNLRAAVARLAAMIGGTP